MDQNLKETRVSIQITEEGMSYRPFQHLINEGEGEMIFSSG